MEKYKAMKNSNDKPKKEMPQKKQESYTSRPQNGSNSNLNGNAQQNVSASNIEGDAPQKSQDEINAENNANNLRNAAEVAANSSNPYAKAAGHAVKAVDKFTGGKALNKAGAQMNKINKMTPGGQQLQNASNKLNESGASDKIGAAAKAKNGGGAKTSSSSGGSFMSSNIMKSGGSMKVKLILICAAFVFIILMAITTAAAGKDASNLDITNKSEMARKSASSADVLSSLEKLANWYIENVTTYTCYTDGKFRECRKFYDNPFTERDYADDCSEFASLYMSYVCGVDAPIATTAEMVDPNSSYAQTLKDCGWVSYTSDEIGSLQSGDVLIAHNGFSYSKQGQHAEIYINENQTFGWGTIKKSYPSNNSISKSEYDGHVHFKDSGHDYITIYRYAGAVNTQDMNIIQMNDASFNHGTKPKENQKYIMLHDTEMSQNAETVVNSWKNTGSGVAAHFVIDRDGTIIQAVDLDTIAHHAGFGGPGDYDSKFGVGNNDGKGNGDDLIGTIPLTGFTSYGMNSYSVGIEMCHVNGEDYPIEQLKSLDKVIMYIDTYFGYKSTIIDHKTWRPSNSDTDSKFATYLENYKNLRHH